MHRPSVPIRALLALLAVTTLTTAAAPAVAATLTDAPTHALVQPGNDTVSQLRVPSDAPEANDHIHVDGDLSSTLTAEGERIDDVVDERAFERAFESASETQGRIDAVDREIERLEARANAIGDARTDAIRAYDDGALTTIALIRELARVRTATRGVTDRIDQVEATVESSSDVSLSSNLSVRLSSVEADLVSLEGPVTAGLTSAVRGESSPRAVYVDAAADGVVLGMIDDDRYVREATVWSARADDGVDQFVADDEPAPAAAYSRAEELYPWASANLVTSPSITGIGDTPIYVVGFTHRHGELTSYLDSRTTDVFYEVQHLRLDRLPTETVASNSSASISVSIEATFEKGPMAVTATDSAGDPVGASVTRGNATLGSTNDEGRLWFVDAGEPRTITVHTDDGESVSVTTDE